MKYFKLFITLFTLLFSTKAFANESEILTLAKAIFYEAQAEPIQGKYAVAHAIMNRVAHKEFPNTVSGVVNQKGQFQWVRNTKLRRGRIFNPANNKEIISIARKVYFQHVMGVRESNVGNAIFFSSNGVRPAPRAIKAKKVGGHQFYNLRPLTS